MPEHLWGMAIQTTQTDDSTATLISRAVGGEEAAFARIVAAHHDDLTRVCYVIAGDLDTADEAVQAAWAIAWRKLRTLREAPRRVSDYPAHWSSVSFRNPRPAPSCTSRSSTARG